MIHCYLGLGSNLNCPTTQLTKAFAALAQIPKTRVIATSSCYQSSPMGPSDQPDYVNAAVAIATELTCHSLLRETQKIELQHGRIRKRERWGPRSLDIDILLYGQAIIAEPELTVPHYGMRERAFVLYPLAEIAPDLVLPCNTPLQTLLSEVDPSGLQRLASFHPESLILETLFNR